MLPPALQPNTPPLPPAQPPGKRIQWLALAIIGGLSLVLLVACAGIFLALIRFIPGDSHTSTVSAASVVAVHLPTVTPIAVDGSGNAMPGLLLQDAFEHAGTSTLEIGEDNDVRYAYEDGKYLIEVKRPDLVVWSRIEGRFANIALQVETTLADDATIAASGLIFRYQDDANFYLYSFANNGFYSLDLIKDGERIPLIDWTPAVIVDGADATTLRVELVEDHIILYANGVVLERTIDSTFTSGEVGLAASTFDAGVASVYFDNLLITTVDGE